MKKIVFGFLAAVTLLLMLWGFYQAIYAAPDEQTMHEVQRIFYYHVPSAMVAFLFFALNFEASCWFLTAPYARKYLRWEENVVSGFKLPRLAAFLMRIRWKFYAWFLAPGREQVADALAVASAEVGVVFCTVVLITGPLWARRAWGIWWTWDARLTTTLILWLIYVSYLLLRRFAAGSEVQTLAAVLAIFGGLDVPIVYMSNRWWRTQHPAPVFGGGADSGIKDPRMLAAFGWNVLAWLLWGLLILAIRFQVERRAQRIAAQEAQTALTER